MGLQYVNNDACYPSLIVIGQIMDALLSGKYDLDHTAVLMSQTGGGCRASNYIALSAVHWKKPVCLRSRSSPSMRTAWRPTWFTFTPGLITKAMQGIVYGDIFMRVLYATRPYEKVPGSANALHEKWKAAASRAFPSAPQT